MTDVAIIGSGFGGLCMGIQLTLAGVDSFTIYEQADSVGGTWRANTYPGAECDIPTSLYSYSFEHYDWPCKWSHQQVIRDYLEHCTDHYDLRKHLKFGHAVVAADFDESAGQWTITLDDGTTAVHDVVVSATGQLSRPRFPDIAGLDSFGGTMFHSAQWDHDHSLAGERVAVIGCGASAAQFVPEIAKEADSVTIFQRTPNWMLPKQDREYTAFEKKAARLLPFIPKIRRFGVYARADFLLFGLMRKETRWRKPIEAMSRGYLKKISDTEKRTKLTPTYPAGAKRVLFTGTFYEAVEEHDVGIETEGIAKITNNAIVTTDGVEHEFDTIILGTGFETNDFLTPMTVTGPGGDLNEVWSEGAEAYLGVTTTGFPNLFFLYGPNTNLGHNSIVLMLESQVRYVLSALHQKTTGLFKSLDVTPEAQRRYNDELQTRLADSAWVLIDDSWYLQGGKVTNNWVGRASEYRRRTRALDLDDYATA